MLMESQVNSKVHATFLEPHSKKCCKKFKKLIIVIPVSGCPQKNLDVKKQFFKYSLDPGASRDLAHARAIFSFIHFISFFLFFFFAVVLVNVLQFFRRMLQHCFAVKLQKSVVAQILSPTFHWNGDG